MRSTRQTGMRVARLSWLLGAVSMPKEARRRLDESGRSIAQALEATSLVLGVEADSSTVKRPLRATLRSLGAASPESRPRVAERRGIAVPGSWTSRSTVSSASDFWTADAELATCDASDALLETGATVFLPDVPSTAPEPQLLVVLREAPAGRRTGPVRPGRASRRAVILGSASG